jgi:uncharacterized membrane protein
VLVVAGLLANPWFVGALTADGSIDRLDLFGAILFVSALCVLGGMQLLVRWVQLLAFGRQVTAVRAAVAVGAFAAAGTLAYCGITAYQGSHDHTTVVSAGHAQATPEQHQWTRDFYRRSFDAAVKNGWFDIDRALSQGFQRDRINRTHFPHPAYMFDDVILDPERPEWLVYDDGPDGKVLMALMFFTRNLEDVGPTPGGPLAQWHYHPYNDVRCAIQGLWTVGKADASGRCAEGVPVTRTPEMFHVWFMDHPIGHFSEMEPDIGKEPAIDLRRLHPLTVHFAIALFVIAVLIDVVGAFTRRVDYHGASWINLALAATAAVAAVGTGMTAEVQLKPTHELHQTLDTHRLLGFGSLAIMAALAMWRYALHGRFPTRARSLYLAMSVAGVALVGGTGFYGGELVYRHGAAVRAIDQFAHDRYLEQVREIRKQQPPPQPDHTGHH